MTHTIVYLIFFQNSGTETARYQELLKILEMYSDKLEVMWQLYTETVENST